MLGVLPKLQLRGNSILLYYEPQYLYAANKKFSTLKLSNFKSAKTYTGEMKTHTRKRLVKAISLLIQASQRRKIYNPILKKKIFHTLSFITLTIPSMSQNVSLKHGYKYLLAPFLNWFRITQGVKTYIWKAEVQKRGQLHYHITTNSWVHHAEIRNKWNYLLSKSELMNEYFLKHKHKNPNSTDVHSVYKLKDLQSYLTKEFQKSIQNNHNSPGKIWDCSNNLKGVNYFSVYMEKPHEINLLKSDQIYKLTEVETPHCIVFKARENMSYQVLTNDEKLQYSNFLQSIRREVKDIFSNS